MNFVSRYKSNSNRQTSNQGKDSDIDLNSNQIDHVNLIERNSCQNEIEHNSLETCFVNKNRNENEIEITDKKNSNIEIINNNNKISNINNEYILNNNINSSETINKNNFSDREKEKDLNKNNNNFNHNKINDEFDFEQTKSNINIEEKQNLIQNTNINSNILNLNDFKFNTMKKSEKKRQSRSASSILRRLFTCGTSCSGEKRSKSNNTSRRSSANNDSPFKNIPEIVIENATNSKCSLSNSKIFDDKPNLSDADEVTETNDDISAKSPPKFVLPILKLNDDIITSLNVSDDYMVENSDEQTFEQLDQELIDEEENEIEDDDNYEQEEETEDQIPDEEYELGAEDEFVEDDVEEDEEEDEEDDTKLLMNLNQNQEEDECDFDGAFHDNGANIIIEEPDELDIGENQVFEEDYNSNDNEKLGINNSSAVKFQAIPSFSFDFHSEDADKTESMIKLDDNHNEDTNTDNKLLKSAPKIADYSKFLTANNIITDRGCIVNIRTGSFNLGCQKNALSSSSLSPERESSNNDDELIDSSEFFNSLPHHDNHGDMIKSSISNYSFNKYSINSSFSSNIDTGSNLLVPLLLIQNRRKNSNVNLNSDTSKKMTTPIIITDSTDDLFDNRPSMTNINLPNSSTEYSFLNPSKNNTSTLNNNQSSIQPSISVNNSLLSASLSPPSEQDQVRRCSHDPNIEKLHKSYINNVKLASAQVFSSVSVSTTNTDSIPNINNKSDSKNFNDSNSSIPFSYTNKDKFKKYFNFESFKSYKSNEKNQSLDSNDKITLNTSSNDDRIEIESEKSDVLNEIFKVNKWLRDNKNHQNNIPSSNTKEINKKDFSNYSMKRLTKLPSMTISEDEDNVFTSMKISDHNQSSSSPNNRNNYYEDENDDNDAKTKYSYENNDSAIDVRSYGSISTLSKASSNKSRVNWQSFSKHYHYYFQSMNTTWSKYQIAAMSIEQIMALRKLALIQFSKLVERQHSSMIRTFRLFSKKNAANEFQKVYDSIDSINASKTEISKSKSNSSNKEQESKNLSANLLNSTSPNANNSNESNVLISNKKASYQLGTQLGLISANASKTGKKKRSRNSIKANGQPVSTIRVELLSINNDENSIASENSKIATSEAQNETDLKQIDKSINKLSTKQNSTAVFGVPLSMIMQLSGQPLPQPILESMRYIRKIALNEVGVFRKNGNKNRINKLKESIDNNEPINFLSPDLSVFDVADTLKLYFRELPECLITNKLSDILLSNYTKIRPEERKIILQQVMLLIPDENRLVLQTLLLFLNDIAKHHKVNQMTRNNLAVCFSPVIFSLNFDYKKKSKNRKYLSNTNSLNESTTIPKLSALNVTTTPLPQLKASLVNKGKEESDKSSLLQVDTKQNEQKRNSTSVYDSKTNLLTPHSQNRLLSVPNNHISAISLSNVDPQNTTQLSSDSLHANKNNSKRKYSDKINKAASSIVNFGVELSTSKTSAFFSDPIKESLENLDYMNKVVQLCVSDMIKYSMDLFTVPVENFEKLKLSVSYGSEPLNLDYFYDIELKKMKKMEFFTNINIEKTCWFYFDKFEDVSVYYYKNDFQCQSILNNINSSQAISNQSSPIIANQAFNTQSSINSTIQQNFVSSSPIFTTTNSLSSSPNILLIPQKNESFNDKLKLWKCCTLVRHQNLTLEKILNRIKNERHLWDDDFLEGRIVEKLDDRTDLYRYVISFMPPHPSRDFFEIRHYSLQQSENETLILTNTSVKHQAGSKLFGDIRSNLIISKYVIEKLIATDTTTTYKITHYIKLDYKGFTLEFYNKTFGYMMARLLYNLKTSLLTTA